MKSNKQEICNEIGMKKNLVAQNLWTLRERKEISWKGAIKSHEIQKTEKEIA